MTEERKDDVIVKKDELSEQELDKASGGKNVTEVIHPPAFDRSLDKGKR